MKHWRMKTGLMAFFAVIGFIGLANTSADAKVVWTFGNSDKSIQTAPKALRGTWYGYQSSYDKHPSKLVINKKSFTVATTAGKRTLKYAKSWKTAYKRNLPNVNLRKSRYHWYSFALNWKQHWDPLASQISYGQVRPVKYGHQKALAYVPVVSEDTGRVTLLTKKKYKHPIYKSAKHMTVINFYGGK
ncbi:hypothetical protein [Levilactobacillus suantsaiihabitans]|uniref:Uncharacterized protein n=1 Tax=Levilactobacillus suantsaiihabitans TaxID=2487722 RepID=A0A4Z0J5E0_9LACO|nr:hypothetical protein [Levilactobacillus suantsaiihabitans]TGD17619.1 hypothetical protein EGT51_11635 [Levilactobacillus suantsaiihabitans]